MPSQSPGGPPALWVLLSRTWSGWKDALCYVFLVLKHDRRRILHFNVTADPTAEWTARIITEALPWETAPRYMIRDRDGVHGDVFRARVDAMGIEEVLIAPRSPWQIPYVERMIGTLRRNCLDHVVVLDERRLRRVIREYLDAYYHCVLLDRRCMAMRCVMTHRWDFW